MCVLVPLLCICVTFFRGWWALGNIFIFFPASPILVLSLPFYDKEKQNGPILMYDSLLEAYGHVDWFSDKNLLKIFIRATK